MRPISIISGAALALGAGGAAAATAGLIPLDLARAVALTGVGLVMGAVVVGSAMPGVGMYGPALTRGPTGTRVSLTFDDGPHPDSTVPLLDALGGAGAGGTFFVLMDAARRSPDLLRRIAREQELGLHGLAHDPSVALLSPGEGAARLLRAKDELEQLTGVAVRWYRAPFGVTSPRLVDAVERARLTHVWCSLRTRDGAGRWTSDRLRRKCARAVGGDIVLMHEGAGRPAAGALPVVLADLGARGLTSVTVGELLG